MKKLILSVLVVLTGLAGFSQKRTAPARSAGDILNEKYCSGLFNTREGNYFDLLNDNMALSARGYLNILDWLQGRVAGLQVYTLKNDVKLPLIRNSVAGIFVDEIQVDPGFLNSLPVTDIAMIKIIKGPFLGGFNSPGGAIAIYTAGTDDEDE
jgi:hypothetical protein